MTDIAVVTDLAVVVEFGATFDDGVGSNATVNAAQGTNLHVVGNHHTTVRLKLLIAFVAALEIIAICTNDATRVDDDVVANHTMVVDGHIGMDQTILPDDSVVTDERARHDECPLTYRRAIADRLGLRLERTEMSHKTHKGIKRIRMQQQGLTLGTNHLLIN